jgi:5-formyltetrahydrofolate cyclo-ligase
MVDKITTRKQGRSLRMSLSPGHRAVKDQAIVEASRLSLNWQEYERILVYVPLEREREIDIWPLIKWIWATWPKVITYAPRISGDAMDAVTIAATTRIRRGAYGVMEPADGNVLTPNDPLNLVLTPLLGFDSAGQRVGYGKGYYDQFFATRLSAYRVGLGYERMRVPTGIHASTHDIPMHVVITETGLTYSDASGVAKSQAAN